MPADFIKINHTTPDKHEIAQMAEILKLDQDCVMGKLLRVWIWADRNKIGHDPVRLTDSFIDRISCFNGFASAMRSVGWLIGENGLLQFKRPNGVNDSMGELNLGLTSSTQPPAAQLDIDIPVKTTKRFVPPTPKEVESYSREIGYPMDGQAWCDSYAQKGWMISGKAKMKDWKCAIRVWKHNGWLPAKQGRHFDGQYNNVNLPRIGVNV